MMRAYPRCRSTQAEGCDMFFKLVRMGFREEVLDAGAMPVVVDALRAHAPEATVLEHGCRALGILCGENKSEATLAIAEWEGLPDVVAAAAVRGIVPQASATMFASIYLECGTPTSSDEIV